MNGTMVLTAGRKQFVLVGGPFRLRPQYMFGVRMAAELHALGGDVVVPTRDFSTPDPKDVRKALPLIFKQLLAGDPVYVGCMGGWGRTGLMLALIAKTWGVRDPITYVRRQYSAHAVETRAQEAYVDSFRVPFWLRMKLQFAKIYFRFS